MEIGPISNCFWLISITKIHHVTPKYLVSHYFQDSNFVIKVIKNIDLVRIYEFVTAQEAAMQTKLKIRQIRVHVFTGQKVIAG